MKSTVTMPDGHRITTMELTDLPPLSEKDKARIRAAAARPVVCDADCPPIPEEMISAMEQAIRNRTAM